MPYIVSKSQMLLYPTYLQRALTNEISINDPISAWILAKLIDEKEGFTRQNLLKNLCDNSFKYMKSVQDFQELLERLMRSGYIYYPSNAFSRMMELNRLDPESDSTHMYKITDKGIYIFKKEFSAKFSNVKNYADQLTGIKKKNPVFEGMLETIKNSSNVLNTCVRFFIKNTPLALSFLDEAIKMINEFK